MSHQDRGSNGFVILGPGSGKNLQCALEHLLSIPHYSFSLICRSYALGKAAFPDLVTLEYGNKKKRAERFGLIKRLISMPKAEIFYVMGTGNIFELIAVALFSRRNYLVLGVWSDNIPNMLRTGGINKILYKAVLRAFDLIQFNWYSTADILVKLAPDLASKIYVQGFGIDANLYQESKSCGEFMQNILGRISQDKIVFLNPRSIEDYNELLLSIEGISLLRNREPVAFSRTLHIYWHGNNVNLGLLELLKGKIIELGLSDAVWCIEHPFLPDSDMAHLLRRSDVIVNFVNRDQFSMSLVEAMLLKKPLICTNIPAYQNINEILGASFRLIEIDAESYADEIIDLLNEIDSGCGSGIYEKRKRIVMERFTKEASTALLEKMFGSMSHQN